MLLTVVGGIGDTPGGQPCKPVVTIAALILNVQHCRSPFTGFDVFFFFQFGP